MEWTEQPVEAAGIIVPGQPPRATRKVTAERPSDTHPEPSASLTAILYGSPLAGGPQIVQVMADPPEAPEDAPAPLYVPPPTLLEIQSALNALTPAGSAWALPMQSHGYEGGDVEPIPGTVGCTLLAAEINAPAPQGGNGGLHV